MHTRTSTRSKRDLFYFIFADFYVIFECEENLPFKIAPSDLYSRTIKSKLLKQKKLFIDFYFIFPFHCFHSAHFFVYFCFCCCCCLSVISFKEFLHSQSLSTTIIFIFFFVSMIRCEKFRTMGLLLYHRYIDAMCCIYLFLRSYKDFFGVWQSQCVLFFWDSSFLLLIELLKIHINLKEKEKPTLLINLRNFLISFFENFLIIVCQFMTLLLRVWSLSLGLQRFKETLKNRWGVVKAINWWNHVKFLNLFSHLMCAYDNLIMNFSNLNVATVDGLLWWFN